MRHLDDVRQQHAAGVTLEEGGPVVAHLVRVRGRVRVRVRVPAAHVAPSRLGYWPSHA